MSRHHAMLFPSGVVMAGIEALRRAWNPDMAAAIGPHITLVYPDEHPGLAAPFRAIAFPPHLTIIHPRTSNRAAEFWLAGVRRVPDSDLTFDSIALTSFDAGRYAIDARFPFGLASDTGG